MISYLEGKIIAQDERSVVLNVNGVGYRIFLKAKSYKLQAHAGFWVHQYQRQEGSELYGFSTKEELDLFEKLLSVSGVGPKSALAVLGQSDVREVVSALAEGEVGFFAKISGIGRKTAERIVIELRRVFQEKGDVKSRGDHVPLREALEALIGLGYRREEARRALEQIPRKVSGVEAQVTGALKVLGQKPK